MAAKSKTADIQILEVERDHVEFCILGTSPVILNRMSDKAKRELLLPRGRKTAADRARSLKHNPIEEFQASPYINIDSSAPTYIEHLSSAFKKAMQGAGLDVPGATKSQLGRLLQVDDERISIYGIPSLFMSVTRSSDMNKTPDIRSRAIIRHWAARIRVNYMKPMLNHTTVAKLLAMAGMTQGLGDWRPEKGSGNYGQFMIVEEKDPEYKRIIREGGYKAQVVAMKDPEFYDYETQELYLWWESEIKERGIEISSEHLLNAETEDKAGKRVRKSM